MDSKEKILSAPLKQAIQLAQTQLYRDMPWRHSNKGIFDPYSILVSEIMLQQTQVARVIEKYQRFLAIYPTVHDLADAELADVLRLWSGLGYNRRAKFLHAAAKSLKHSTDTWTYEDLVACKGIGPNTAKAVLVYSYNYPEIFIETNIRTVIIYYCFKDTVMQVTDKQILDVVQNSIDIKEPRIWYWAMMDLGSFLKQNNVGQLHNAQAYKKQTQFKGSKRQIRGQVLRQLGAHRSMSLNELQKYIQDDRLTQVLQDLIQENLISQKNNMYFLGT